MVGDAPAAVHVELSGKTGAMEAAFRLWLLDIGTQTLSATRTLRLLTMCLASMMELAHTRQLRYQRWVLNSILPVYYSLKDFHAVKIDEEFL